MEGKSVFEKGLCSTFSTPQQHPHLPPAGFSLVGYHPVLVATATLLLLLSLAASAIAQAGASSKEVDAVYPQAHDLYVDLHQNPELSAHETQTASKLAARLRNLGYDVTEHVGGTGLVAILRNGNGPTAMLRTELDALSLWRKRPAFPTPAQCTRKTTPGTTSR
jgi:hypothetical protein